jgi:hypothetical protein
VSEDKYFNLVWPDYGLVWLLNVLTVKVNGRWSFEQAFPKEDRSS